MAKVEITKTEIVWPGKYEEDGTRKAVPRVSLPLDVVETIPASVPGEAAWRNKLILGDNLLAIGSLLETLAGKVDLVYIDPPFAKGLDFVHRTPVGDGDPEESGETPHLATKAYGDRWGGGIGSYLDMISDRVRLIRDLMSESGSIYVHLDATVGHYVKPLLDEIFGPASFQREVIWRIGWVSGYKSAARNWIRNHDAILFYVKTPGRFTFNKEYVPYPPGYTRRGGKQTTGKGYPIEDVWNANPFEFELTGEDSLDSIQIKSLSREKTGYATQKNESLLRRIVRASSNPGDLVADFFCGSGTTLAAAEKLGRRWIGCDIGRLAIHTARKRLLGIEGAKPFEILSLGRNERRTWRVEAFEDGAGAGKDRPIDEHRAFILKLHGARPISGPAHIHGEKGGAAVHVGAIDSAVAIGEIGSALAECVRLGRGALEVLGWEWEGGVQDAAAAGAKKSGVDLILLQIPREVMERQPIDPGGARFLEIARVDVEVKTTRKLAATAVLTDFGFPHPERIPEEIRSRIRKWSDPIDYWAVDWDFRGGSFSPGWAAFRTRADRTLVLRSDPHAYASPGLYRVLVKVVDVFGSETTRSFEVDVK